MKKVTFVFALLAGVAFSSTAQISASSLQNAVNKVTTTAKTAGIDVNAITSSIMAKLTTSLALTKTQTPDVQKAVTSFLEQKSSFLSLSATDKAKYTTKLNEALAGLKTKLKTTLTPAQLTKFASLKPATNSASNVLSPLYY